MSWETEVLSSLGWTDASIHNLHTHPDCLSNPYRNLPFWHKGQTHCHSKESHDGHDGKWGLEGAYQEMGYSFVCLTDHNQATPDPGREGIIHIDSGEDGDACRHHLCVLGINWDAVHWHHDQVDPHRDKNQNGLDDRPTCFCENIQPRIDYATQIQQTVAVLAHPTSSHYRSLLHTNCGGGWTLEHLLESRNYTGIEIFNGGAWSHDWWDEVLKTRKQVWGFAADDCHDLHSRKSFNRGWIVVNSALNQSYIDTPQEHELRQDILQNIKHGNFVAVVRSPMEKKGDTPSRGTADSGPRIRIGVMGNTVVAQMDQTGDIYFVVGTPTERRTPLYQAIDRAVYELAGDEIYVRVEAWQNRPDGEQYCTFSQPLFVIR